jgi:membrane-associated protease RseP (regulator of RpoE activity)
MDTRSAGGGISGLVAAVVAVGTLLIGLVAGLALGGAGGFLLGHRAGRSATEALGQRADRTSADSLRRVPTDRVVPTPGSAPDAQVNPVPGMPEIRVWGSGSPYLGVEVTAAEAPATPGAGDSGAARAGALVQTVVPDTAAAQAGIEVGDLIVAIDDQAIASPADLSSAIARAKVGDTISLTVVRNGTEQKIAATLGTHTTVIPLDPSNPSLDDLLQQLPPELRDRFRGLATPPGNDSGA